jgi:hypothetical protein
MSIPTMRDLTELVILVLVIGAACVASITFLIGWGDYQKAKK